MTDVGQAVPSMTNTKLVAGRGALVVVGDVLLSR